MESYCTIGHMKQQRKQQGNISPRLAQLVSNLSFVGGS